MVHVLLTGFPGFLAERLIRRCQEAGDEIFWHLIVLPEQLALATHTLRDLNLTVSDYAIYPGDITRPDLGLPGQDAQKLQRLTERCFHLAALYDLTAPAAASAAVNVRGTRRVLEFLTRCPQLTKFNYVSTCYISGTLEGDILEDELPEPLEFRNEYERTKHEAEKLVRAYLDKIPTTIFRPSVVVGDSQTGETSKFDGPYVLIRFLRWARHLFSWMPNFGFETTRFNCIPVDFATDLLRDVGFSDEFVGKTLQVADPKPPTTSDSYRVIYRQTTGRRCYNIPDWAKRFVLWLLHRFPFDLMTGIPAESLDYFSHRGLYGTANLEAACQRFDIEIPKWTSFYKPVIRFALTEQRHAPNSGVIREFKRWCFAFRFIYPVVGILFLVAPALVTGFLTMFDEDKAAIALVTDNLLWRPLSISLLATLFVAVTFLERDPFQKPLHGLIIGAKSISSAMFFAYAATLGMVSLIACGVIDGLIGFFHMLFYYRLSRVREMSGSGFRWDPYHLFFPKRFLTGFTESMAPQLDDPVDVPLVVESIRAEVRRFPFLYRYGFVLACYVLEFVLPCLRGFSPFFLMTRERRRQFLKSVQHSKSIPVKLPLIFVKFVSTAHLFAQKPYLRSIGAE